MLQVLVGRRVEKGQVRPDVVEVLPKVSYNIFLKRSDLKALRSLGASRLT